MFKFLTNHKSDNLKMKQNKIFNKIGLNRSLGLKIINKVYNDSSFLKNQMASEHLATERPINSNFVFSYQ